MSSEANNDAAESPATPSPDAPEPTADGDKPVAEHALPSVIIDPSASEPSLPAVEASVVDNANSLSLTAEASVVEAAPTGAEPATDAATNPDASDEGEWSVGTLSEREADHFAESMRPSWDMTATDADTSWAAATNPVASTTAPAPRTIAVSTDSDDDLPPVAIPKGLDRRMLLAGGSALLVIAMVVWSMSGGEPEAPPSWNKQTSVPQQQQAATPAKTPDEPSSPVAPSTPVIPALGSNEPVVPHEPPPPAPNTAAPTPAPRDVVAKSVHVRISTVPASADVKLDGEAVPNPFDAWVARGGAHTITASADGYTEREWSVAFDQDQTLSLVLKHVEVRRPAARRVRRAPPKKPASQTSSRPRGAGFVTDNPY